MACRAYVQQNILAQGRTCFDHVAAAALGFDVLIIRMCILFHVAPLALSCRHLQATWTQAPHAGLDYGPSTRAPKIRRRIVPKSTQEASRGKKIYYRGRIPSRFRPHLWNNNAPMATRSCENHVSPSASTSGPDCLKVAVAAPVYGLFDYLPLPTTTPDEYQPGQRVAVPFGRRIVTGIIMQVGPCDNATLRLKPIAERLETAPLFTPQMLAWLTWAARYYSHPLGEVVAGALPTQLRKPQTYTHTLISRWRCQTPDITLPPQATRQRELLALLAQHPSGLWQDTLVSMGFSRPQLRSLENKGAIHEVRVDPISAQTEVLHRGTPAAQCRATSRRNSHDRRG